MILLCYDGSDDAKAAIGEASKLFSGQKATVLTVWQPFAEVLASTTLGWGIAPGVLDIEQTDEASREAPHRDQIAAAGQRSHAVLQRADRTVIVVPSPAVASSRKRRHDRSPGSR
jgi:hypothetical protein